MLLYFDYFLKNVFIEKYLYNYKSTLYIIVLK